MKVVSRGLLLILTVAGVAGCGSKERKGCKPGEHQACYTGPQGTEEVGICHGGIAYCDDIGQWGPCLDEQVPVDENCFNAYDDDCDGQVNEEGAGCACEPDSVSACYGGDPATQGVGICVAGSMTCDPWGSGWGPCEGEVLPRQEDFHQPGDENCDGISSAEFQWAIAAGGVDFEAASAVSVDGDGNLVVGLQFMGEFTLGSDTYSSPTGVDSVLLKLDGDGNTLWGRQVGDGPAGSGSQEIESVVAVGADEIYVAGRFDGIFGPGNDLLESPNHFDVWAARLNGDGEVVWDRQFSHTSGGSPSYGDKQAFDIAIAGDKLVLVGRYAGDFGSPGGCLGGMCILPAATGGSDPFVVLVDRETGGIGDPVHFVSSSSAAARKVAVYPDGEMVVAGIFALDHDVLPGQAGGDWPSAGGTDIFVVKLDAELTPVWHNTVGTGRADSLGALVLGPQGHPVVVGAVEDILGGNALLVYKMNKESSNLGGMGIKEYPLASRLFADAPDASVAASGAVLDEAGNLLIAGSFEGSAVFGHETLLSLGKRDGFVLMLDTGLAPVWARLIGSQGMDMAMDLAMSPDDTVVLAGLMGDAVDFGAGPVAFGGQVDAFVAKLNP